MARFYSNENFPLVAVLELRKLGHDVLTTFEAGNANQRIRDEDVLACAVAMTRVVLTINRKHFIALHQRTSAHCGIVVCTLDPDFGRQAERIDRAVGGHPELRGILLRVNRP